jgi:TRAP-type mannitol/chloroaromatic compound transport system permease small subunit
LISRRRSIIFDQETGRARNAARAVFAGRAEHHPKNSAATNWGIHLTSLLRFSRTVDWLNVRFGWIATWMVILSCAISAGNAFVRYSVSYSSNGWLEIQWYMFAVMFMLGAPYTMKVNEHVRVDILYGQLSLRAQLWLDLVCTILFMLPAMLLLCYLAWPIFWNSWLINETSNNAGGLLRWPVKFFLPFGFLVLCLQGFSEVIKRLAAIAGHEVDLPQYKAPDQ